MEEAGVKALEYDDKTYRAAGLSPMPLTQSPALIRLMERNYNATPGRMAKHDPQHRRSRTEAFF